MTTSLRSQMPINPVVLKWARKSVQLSESEAAGHIGVKIEVLIGWEDGSLMPSYPQLRKIGAAYKRSTGVFFLTSVPQDPPLPKDFRVLPQEQPIPLSSSTIIEIRRAQRQRLYAIELAKGINEPIKPFSWKISLQDDPEKIGNHWRARFLKISDQNQPFTTEYTAFRFWRRSIERHQVLVFQTSLESLDEFRGVAIFDVQIPTILLNTKDSVRGRIFSLLHEFCHLLLHTSGIGNMEATEGRDENSKVEVFCNAFAGACLVPTDELLNKEIIKKSSSSNPLSIEEVSKIAKQFQVSWEVILRRLLFVGKISANYYKGKREEIASYFNNKTKEDKGFAEHVTKVHSQNGEFYSRLVLENYYTGNITSSEVSEYLRLKFGHIGRVEVMMKSGRDLSI